MEGGRRRRILGFRMAGAFFDCSEVVVVAKNSEKKMGDKKKRKGYKGNKEEYKSPPDGISAVAEMIIRKSASTGRLPERFRYTASSRVLSLLSDACSDARWERRGGAGRGRGGTCGKT